MSRPFFLLISLLTATLPPETVFGKLIRIDRSQNLGPELGTALVIEPAHQRPKAVLICLHGIQSNREWWLPMGKELAEKGYAVWAFNRPGSGDPVPPGPADVATTTWDEQMLAVRRQAELTHKGVPAFAVGVSWGASPATVAVERVPDAWAGAILLNPAFATTKDGKFKQAVLGKILLPWRWFAPIKLPLEQSDYTDSAQTKAERLQPAMLKQTATLRFMLKTNKVKKNAVASLDNPKRPVLLLLGSSDHLVAPKDFAQRLRGRLTNSAITHDTIPAATHAAIVEHEHRAFAQRILIWLPTAIRR